MKVMRTFTVAITIDTERGDDDVIIRNLAMIVSGAFADWGVKSWPGVIVPPDVIV